MMLKDRITLYKLPFFLQSPCLYCEDPTHAPPDCPSLIPSPNPRTLIFSRIVKNSLTQCRKLHQRFSHKFNTLFNLPKIQEQAFLILENHAESISVLIEDIYASSECDNSNDKLEYNSNNSNNETSDFNGNNIANPQNFANSQNIANAQNPNIANVDRSMTDSKFDDQNIVNPSIFLQPNMKNTRKSTGSIFEEKREEEEEINEEEDDQAYISSKLSEEKKKSEKNLDENTRHASSENNLLIDDKKINKAMNSSSLPSDKFYSEKDSSINVNSLKNSRAKELHKILSSERDSKFFTEKDTMHFLQNFDKLEKKAIVDRLNSSSHKTTNTNTYHSGEKRNGPSCSYTKSTSYISSSHKLLKKRNIGMPYAYKSTHNRKANYSDYLKNTLFWYDFEKMANFDNYFPHNNIRNVIKNINNNGILRFFKDERSIKELKKSFHSNLANTSYSSKKTAQKVQQTEKSNVETEENKISINK